MLQRWNEGEIMMTDSSFLGEPSHYLASLANTSVHHWCKCTDMAHTSKSV